MEVNPVDPVLTPLWPDAHIEVFDESWPDLTLSAEEVGKWVLTNKKVLVRTITWNLCANPPPSSSDISVDLLPKDRFHVYIVGTEECERSIAKSAWNPSKKSWEAYLRDAMGSNYIPLRSHTLQAIHLMAFVHKAIAPMCSLVTSAAVPTGMGSTLGNKGGVGLLFKIGETRLLIVNAHLAAHQTAEKRRNAEFNRINRMVPILLEKKETAIISSSQVNTPKGSGSGATNGKLFALPFGFGSSEKDTAFTPTKDETTVQSLGASQRNMTENHANNKETTPHTSSIETIIGPHGEILDVVDRVDNNSSAVSAQDTPTVGSDTLKTSSTPTGEILSEEDMKPSSQLDLESTATKDQELGTTVENANKSTTIATNTGNIDSMDGTTIADSMNNNNTEYNTTATPTNNVSATTGNKNNNNENGSSNVLGIDTPDEENIEIDVNRENAMDGTAILDVPDSSAKTLENTGDFVVFMGDLNYRIKGNRKIVSSLVANNMHEVLQHNDQLRWNMTQKLVLQNFTEGPLNFKPTYKYDVGTTSTYDTSSKGRIPSWTDRILFIPRPDITCLAYNAVDSITTSDHHPVYASFSIGIQLSNDKNSSASSGSIVESMNNLALVPEFTSESQVCRIM